VVRIDALVYARKLSAETRTMSVRMGRKFAEMGAHVTNAAALHDWRERVIAGTTPGCYPVALAVNFAAQGLSARDAFVVHQYGVAATILGAGAAADAHQPHGHAADALCAQRLTWTPRTLGGGTASLDDMAGFAPLARSSRPCTSRRTYACS
jgi:urease accessory protein